MAAVGLTYDAASRVTAISRTQSGIGTNVASSLAYDSADRVTTLTHQVSGGASLDSFVYGYDSGGRLRTETNTEGLATYGYDAANQLTSVTRPAGQTNESYSYDFGGNRTMTGYTTGVGNELLASPGATYAYDAEGNLAAKTETSTGNVWSYTYDIRNRMTGVTEKNSGGTVIYQASYTYDALDRRIATTVNGTTTWTVYDGQNTYADFSGAGALKTRYLYGPAIDELFARTDSSGTTAWYLTDRLGSVRDLASTSGAALDHLAYDAYGNIVSETQPSNGDRFKFYGFTYATSSHLLLVGSEAVDTTIGVRLTPKNDRPYASLYEYYGNNPIRGPHNSFSESPQDHFLQLLSQKGIEPVFTLVDTGKFAEHASLSGSRGDNPKHNPRPGDENPDGGHRGKGNREKHEGGDERRNRDQGREKGDKNRKRYRRDIYQDERTDHIMTTQVITGFATGVAIVAVFAIASTPPGAVVGVISYFVGLVGTSVSVETAAIVVTATTYAFTTYSNGSSN